VLGEERRGEERRGEEATNAVGPFDTRATMVYIESQLRSPYFSTLDVVMVILSS
jgi:hypothetical protein